MSAAAAKAWCAGDAACAGYTAPGACNTTWLSKVFFKSHGGNNGDKTWASWVKARPPAHLLTGPPAGIVLPSGRILIEYYAMGPTFAGTLISDDDGKTFRPSANNLTGRWCAPIGSHQ